jgi:tRNA threonylcarbamoyladenosine biosynthesis protein TsaE
MEIVTCSPRETKKVGELLAKEALATKVNQALVFNLEGDLGSGKTTFVQGFARGLGIKDKILSPTFGIFNFFQIKKKNKFKFFYHFDCYRINSPEEISALGFQEIVSDPCNVVVIEWAERIKRKLPRTSLTIKFKTVSEKERKIALNF